jgi:transposase-like protein
MPRNYRNIQNCGRAFCKGAVRMAWAVDEWTLPEAAAAIGRKPTTILRCAEALQLPLRARQAQPKPISRARLLELWTDTDRTVKQIAAELGISTDALTRRARAHGFPPRARGAKTVYSPPADFPEMWRFGVGVAAIAREHGCANYTVSRWAREAGLPLRYQRLKARTMAEYIEHTLAKQMAQGAAKERAAWHAKYGKAHTHAYQPEAA